jgi:zinc transport system substrate-binding protein
VHTTTTRRSVLLAMLAGAGLGLTACGSGSSAGAAASGTTTAASGATSSAAAAVTVVAATSWEGALAKAAGATDVTVIAPANLTHAADYDPKPADLVSVAGADYILYAEFEGFAGKLKEATGSEAKLVTMTLENTPGAVRAEVTRLAGMFGTTDAATAWLTTFDAEYAKLSGAVRAALPAAPPAVVSQAFMAYWAKDFAGLDVVGTYGPEQITPAQLADLTAKKPAFVVANAHMPGDPEITGAKKLTLVNYPGADLDLLSVFRTNADLLTKAFAG